MIKRLLLAAVLLASLPVHGAARIGSWAVIQSSADPLTQDITVPSGTELLVLAVCIFDTGTPLPTAVTLAGNAMTLATRVTSDAGEQTGIWTINNPTSGTNSLVFNHTGAIDEGAHFYWAAFEDVDTAGTPVTSLGSINSGSTAANVTTPTGGTAQTGDIAVGVGCVYAPPPNVAITGEVAESAEFNNNQAGIGEIAGSGAAVSFTVTGGDYPSVSGIIVENATGGGGGSALPVIIQQQSKAANDDRYELVANSRH